MIDGDDFRNSVLIDHGLAPSYITELVTRVGAREPFFNRGQGQKSPVRNKRGINFLTPISNFRGSVDPLTRTSRTLGPEMCRVHCEYEYITPKTRPIVRTHYTVSASSLQECTPNCKSSFLTQKQKRLKLN